MDIEQVVRVEAPDPVVNKEYADELRSEYERLKDFGVSTLERVQKYAREDYRDSGPEVHVLATLMISKWLLEDLI